MKALFQDFRGRKATLIKLVICVGLILISALIGSFVQTAGWSCSIQDLRNKSNTGTIVLQANDTTEPQTYAVKGSVTSGILIIPKTATPDAPAPAIVYTHGLYNNREMQLQNGIEAARRGFVVLLIDREGHGHNDTTTRNNYGDSMVAAAKYLFNLTDKNGLKIVDGTKIAVSGHSMGGNATNSALALDGVDTTGKITTASGTSNWVGNTDEALKAGYHMGIISAGIVQANNASNASYGSNLLGVGIIKASSDEFFYSSTTKSPVYVAIAQDETTMTSAMFYQGVNGIYTGSTDGKIYVKSGSTYRAVTSKDHFAQHTQYYAYTTRANSVYYLESAQAMAFVGQNIATVTSDQYEVLNGGIYDFKSGKLVQAPTANALVSKATNGKQLSSATVQLRAIYEARETHPMNHFSTASASHIIDFLYAVFGTPAGAKFIQATNQTWLAKEIFAIFGMIGLFGLLIVLVDILLQTKLFASLKASEGEVEPHTLLLKSPVNHVFYWIPAILTCWFGAYSLTKVTTWYQNSLFAAWIDDTTSEITGLTLRSWANINTIAYWGILCGVFAIVVSALVWFINRIVNMIIHKDNYQDFDQHPFQAFKMRSFGNVIKTIVLVGILVAVFYGIVKVLWEAFVVDFRFWTFDFRTFQLDRLTSYLRYLPFFFIFYMVSAGMSAGYRVKDLPEWATILINVVFNVISLIFLFGIQNSHFIATGGLISSSNKLFYIACYPIIPCVIFATVVARRLYVRTGNAWLAGLLNAVIFTFVACANTSVSGIF